MKPRFNTLNEWLSWQESLHWTTIDLGLERIRDVAQKMQLLDPSFTIITVAGTNGKGSTVAILDAILLVEGYVTGTTTSPYLYRYNERIKISGNECDDALICSAFEAIDEARGAISLTYFEFSTLAAIWIFQQQGVQVALLEVGMGGRLDAVNCWDADVAIITSIGIDHVKWLGDNREAIGREKSGIMRQYRPVISGDPNPPLSLGEQAREKGALLFQVGEQFSWEKKISSWSLYADDRQWLDLPFPVLQGDFQFNNSAVAITALYSLKSKLKVSDQAIRAGLQTVHLSGRLEQVQTKPDIILDVAHNSHAAKVLTNWLINNPVQGNTYALFSMLGDKDIVQVVAVMESVIDHWFIATVDDPRALSLEDLASKMKSNDRIDLSISSFEVFKSAWKACKNKATEADRIIVFGSFLVLSQFKVIF